MESVKLDLLGTDPTEEASFLHFSYNFISVLRRDMRTKF